MSQEQYLLLPNNSNHNGEFTTHTEDGFIQEALNWRSRQEKLQILISYMIFGLYGIQTQVIGILIPKFQEYYKINDVRISFIFLAISSAYIPTTLSIKYIYIRAGTKGIVILGCIFSTIGNLVISIRPPFFMFILGFILNGIAFGNLDAGLNAWISGLTDSIQLLGALHGLFSIGCMVSPIFISSLLKVDSNSWAQCYYLLSLMSFVCCITSILLFKYESPNISDIFSPENRNIAPGINDDQTNIETSNNLRSSTTSNYILKSRLIWKLSIIMFIYVGGESSITSWLITYLTRIKTLPYSSSSLMATGFWAGLAFGRMLIGLVAACSLGNELKCNFIYTLSSFTAILLFWLTTSFCNVPIIFLSIFMVGIFVGPIYPTLVSTSMKFPLIRSSTIAMGLLCAIGNSGSAIIPFFIGVVADSNSLGLKVFPFLVSSIFGFLFFLWIGLIKYHDAT